MWDLSKARQEQLEIQEKLSAGDRLDYALRVELQKRNSFLEELIAFLEQQEGFRRQQRQCEELLTCGDSELIALAHQDIEDLQKQIAAINVELEDLLYPADPRDARPCFIEIRAGAGGQEASLFVGDLLRMYTAYAQRRGWDVSLHSLSSTEVGGAREAILYIKGKRAFGTFKFESGVHRVQRVPETEAAGRIHTSTVTVAVMSEADDVEVNLKDNDIRIDVYRSSGAGGQHVNTTDSAVRITHLPTGIVVTCQDERSQIKNKAKALKELRSRILEAEIQKADDQRSQERKSQIGSGDRSEKIRTYNYPQNRVTDHRVNLTLKKLDLVMNGDMEELLEGIQEHARRERIAYETSKGN